MALHTIRASRVQKVETIVMGEKQRLEGQRGTVVITIANFNMITSFIVSVLGIMEKNMETTR